MGPENNERPVETDLSTESGRYWVRNPRHSCEWEKALGKPFHVARSASGACYVMAR